MRSRSLLFIFAVFTLHAQTSYTISTVAGAATTFDGYTGDGGLAIEARLNRPAGLALDGSGNLYIADTWNHVIRLVDHSGRIRTVAGSGAEGYAGDGGPALQAKFLFPAGLALDSHGDLYIADEQTNRIRRIGSDGIITTFAGTGQRGFSGDGGAATAARLSGPGSMVFDASGVLFFTDDFNNGVRKITPDGVISTLARFGQFDRPAGIAIGRTGDIYVALRGGDRVVRIEKSGTVATFAGDGVIRGNSGMDAPGDGGPAVSASIPHPTALAFDHNGHLLIAAGRLRQVDKDGIVETIPGGRRESVVGPNGALLPVRFGDPQAMVVGGEGDIFVADTYAHRVLRTTPTGATTVVAGLASLPSEKEGGPVEFAQLFNPWGIATAPTGELFIADTGRNRILHVGQDGHFMTVAGKGLSIVRIEGSGPPPQFSGDGGPADKADLDEPNGVAVDAQGNIYISDSLNNRIRKITTNGEIQTIAGNGQAGFSGDGEPAITATLAHPMGLAVDASGNIYIADRENNRIRKISPDGIITTVIGNGEKAMSGEGLALSVTLNFPHGVALDTKGTLYVADTFNHRILRLDPDGIVRQVAGSGRQEFTGDEGPAVKAGLGAPDSLAIDARGNVYIAARANWRIRKITTDGIIHTIAGNNQSGFHGDGGPAVEAPVFPTGVAVGPDGVIYLTDHNRIRKLTPDPSPQTPNPPDSHPK